MKRRVLLLVAIALTQACSHTRLSTPPVASGAPRWSHQAGGQIWSPLTLVNNILYYGCDDGTITALDVRSQQVRWQYETDGRVRSAVTVAADVVFAASDDGFVYAIERSSGVLRWGVDVARTSPPRVLPAQGPPYDYDYLQSSPVYADGMVFVGSPDGQLYAINAEAGAVRWRFRTAGKVRSTPVVLDGTVYFGSWDGHVYAIDATSGKQRWRYDTGGIVQGSPTVSAGLLYVGSRAASLFALDIHTGRLVWQHPFADGSWVESSPVVEAGVLYVGTSDARELLALAADTGKVLWQFDTGGWSWSTPRYRKGTVYIGSISAFPYSFDDIELKRGLYAVAADTGAEKWRLVPEAVDGYITGGFFSRVQVADGVVYAAAIDGTIYAIQQ